MRFVVAIALLTLPNYALAHVGHLGDVANHSHWIGLGALVLAGLVGYAASGKSSDEKEEEEANTEADAKA